MIDTMSRPRRKVLDLNLDVDVKDALSTRVTYGGAGTPRSLGYIARKHPLQLERLMAITSPNDPIFPIICKVYEHHEKIIRKATSTRQVSGNATVIRVLLDPRYGQ